MDAYFGVAGLEAETSDQAAHFAASSAAFPELLLPLTLIGHDAAAAVAQNGRIVFAVEEERLSRTKHHVGFPEMALASCRAAVGGSRGKIAHYLDPNDAHLAKRLASFGGGAFGGGAVGPSVERDFRAVEARTARMRGTHPGMIAVSHHAAHAASAFFPSGFDRALVLVLDGYGESLATSVHVGDERGVRPIVELATEGSLGALYALVTRYLGFEALEDEYKVMGLAAYAKGDEHRAFFDATIELLEDGAFTLPDLRMTPFALAGRWFPALGRPRRDEQPIEPRHTAIAGSLQRALERTVLRLVTHHAEKSGIRNLCLAGGVALNCTMNGVLDRSGLFDEIFVQPASGDAGTAIGGALAAFYADHPNGPRARMNDAYLGPAFDDAEVERALASFGSEIVVARPADIARDVAARIANGEVVGWFRGRMEFGPRALGNRSILADPRRAEMQDHVNRVVKKREQFRPFAPAVPTEHADDFFVLRKHRQYEHMTITVPARAPRAKEIPAVVHVNGTSRVQVVTKETNRAFWELLTRFGQQTGVPVLLNTSFNVRGEPIVCTPTDAVRCFLGTGLDALALESFLVTRP